MSKFSEWFYKRQNGWFSATVILAFASLISFFQIDSAWADANNFNGIFGWLGIGIVCGLGAIYCLYMANKTSTGTGG